MNAAFTGAERIWKEKKRAAMFVFAGKQAASNSA